MQRFVLEHSHEESGRALKICGGDELMSHTFCVQVARVGLPACIHDVWEHLGQPEDCRYTWDTLINTNKNVDFKCRIRFDRLYLRQAANDGVPQLRPEGMALLGLQKLECGRYISDHWGIRCEFNAE